MDSIQLNFITMFVILSEGNTGRRSEGGAKGLNAGHSKLCFLPRKGHCSVILHTWKPVEYLEFTLNDHILYLWRYGSFTWISPLDEASPHKLPFNGSLKATGPSILPNADAFQAAWPGLEIQIMCFGSFQGCSLHLWLYPIIPMQNSLSIHLRSTMYLMESFGLYCTASLPELPGSEIWCKP